jgi:lysophospholipase L1-like esterase
LPAPSPPSFGADDFIPPRLELNRKIMEEAKALQIPSVDFFTATADRDGRLREAYASDGLHLNSKGYEKMARALYEAVFMKEFDGRSSLKWDGP